MRRKSKILSVLLTLACVFAISVLAISQGPNSPATSVNDASLGVVAWTNPGNATASDNNRATAVVSTGNSSQYLKTTDYGFSVGGTINGVLAETEVSVAAACAGSCQCDRIELVIGDAIVGNTNCNSTVFTTTDTYLSNPSSGAETDLWGNSITAAQVNATDFGVAYKVKHGNAASATVRVDHIRMTVYYTMKDRRRRIVEMSVLYPIMSQTREWHNDFTALFPAITRSIF